MSDPQKTTQALSPTLAIALKYDPGAAPRVVARGHGSVAAAIIAKARENGISIEEDPVLAEALASVEMDTEIPVELFQAVAKVISYIIMTRRTANDRQ